MCVDGKLWNGIMSVFTAAELPVGGRSTSIATVYCLF